VFNLHGSGIRASFGGGGGGGGGKGGHFTSLQHFAPLELLPKRTMQLWLSFPEDFQYSNFVPLLNKNF